MQHRGADQLVYAIEDVRHACDLGIRSILPADPGLIWVLNEMKAHGELPPKLVIKSSVTLAAANPATAKLFDNAVMGDGLADEGVGVRHSAAILSCALKQVNEGSPRHRLQT